jgi:hypothetical protein
VTHPPAPGPPRPPGGRFPHGNVPEPGPLERRIWQAAPFCEPASEDEQLDPDAIYARAILGLHLCLLCGARAWAAIIAWPAGGVPFWADLCPRCFMAVKYEQAGLF